MRVIVLGAGVVGVTTAYYLQQAGHQVTVLEQGNGPAEGASYGNAGGLCPGFSGPWASPGVLRKGLGWLLKKNAPLAFGRGVEFADLSWLQHFVANCRRANFARNKARMQRIAHYSQARLIELNRDLGWGENYDFRPTGVLQLFRDPKDLAAAESGAVRVLQAAGVAHRLAGNDQLVALDPALAGSAQHFVGGLLLPGDASGDSHKFSQALADWLSSRGVEFRYGQRIEALIGNGRSVNGVRTERDQFAADAVVVALGASAAKLLKPWRIRLPIRPVKGYSLTARIKSSALAPSLAVMDEQHKTFVARLGDRIRIAGMAEISGFDARLPDGKRAFLQERLEELYPGVAAFSDAEFWSGLRPMTWDGPPILGKTPVERLFLNAGHGSSGWTQACGTGRIVADIVSGKTPDLDLDGLTLDRFGKAVIG
ncbi:MAG: D-amino acid dehydrogenase [Rhodocyclales bacterium GT-UBC]|nr:MAG: D-amino acid dehydrogenase [Rhodocyclales bacterium GT-UBC]